MKIKKNLNIATDDFWYDLIYGGKLNPVELLENHEDVEKVKNAINILLEFYGSCEEQIEGFLY